jgi:hypothetical protein
MYGMVCDADIELALRVGPTDDTLSRLYVDALCALTCLYVDASCAHLEAVCRHIEAVYRCSMCPHTLGPIVLMCAIL